NPVLQPNTKYYWRARASSFMGTGAWSEVWVFNTGSGSSAQTGITQIGSEIPVEYKLYNNYPNPFNPVTSLRFDLPSDNFVKLAVYDILGREIKILVNSELKSGFHTVDFEASDLPSGIYFYTISTTGFTDTKKMILLK
ncbi:MAG: T9SS type A sorting domain-containing protein, partial [Ignavibacteria bacterium]|nr:T9SS type A sorting domain-containing protein [Ignavibacteria bacterium]